MWYSPYRGGEEIAAPAGLSAYVSPPWETFHSDYEALADVCRISFGKAMAIDSRGGVRHRLRDVTEIYIDE